MNSYNQLKDLLLAARLRVTIPRLLILDILDQSLTGLTVLEIEKKMLKEGYQTSFPTVYNILKTFEHKNIIHRFKIGNEQASFSMIKKTGTIKIICEYCKQQTDIQELNLEQDIQHALSQYYAKLNSYSLLLNVRCHQCKE
jgi:Fe2+ or Zn2+ uptake regulation protein